LRMLRVPVRFFGNSERACCNICVANSKPFAATSKPTVSERELPRGARFRSRSKRLAAKYGWRIVAAVFAFYLIRDLVLYVLLPYLAIRTFAW
jgi:hypothetical protein